MAISEIEGNRFIEVRFTATSGDTWAMSQARLIKAIRLTSRATKIADADYITFFEAGGDNPNVFIMTSATKEFRFKSKTPCILAIDDYSLTNPADVVLSIEVD